MKIFIPMFCLVSITLSEPPVGDGYEASRSTHNDHDHEDHQVLNHQQSLSQEYGAPSDSSSRSTLSTDYGAPSDAASRSTLSTDYGLPNARTTHKTRGQSQNYSPAAARVSFNQRFRSSAARNSAKDYTSTTTIDNSHEFATRKSQHEISQNYGPPAARSPFQGRRITSEPSPRSTNKLEARFSSSQKYEVPSVEARSSQKPQSHLPNFRNSQPAKLSSAGRSQFQSSSQTHGLNAFLSRSDNKEHSYDEPNPSFGFRSAPSSNYGAPSQSQTLSTSRSISSVRNFESQELASQTHGASSQRSLSDTYGAPNARSLSGEYVPSNRADTMTEAVHSSHASGRSSPSSTYLPAAHSSMPTERYGVPEQRDGNNQGYDYAKARALEELQNQEPASYDFAYQIEDQESGGDFGHSETREDNRVEGSYFVVLPDGTKHTVEYEADERGFKPRISIEPAAASEGYDENAADIARSAQGPY